VGSRFDMLEKSVMDTYLDKMWLSVCEQLEKEELTVLGKT